ncbi:DUF3617 domain-containing protein [Henriciella marina]|uniref:DUF3617 family protein n=1 Tax=Henriciella marina TaxID=453851 RepID=A0ABT4LWE4_9PROT|nr:DUF3617 family protein [Henriciella marina]MCZ4298699.1 DUF3617 family protein [Henriciella marina]
MTARIFALGLSALTFSGSAFAQSNVAEGLWSYQARYMIGPIPAGDRGQYCVGSDMSQSSFDQLFNDINSRCRVTDSETTADGYDFKLQCSGGPDGELDGKLQVGADTAILNATGWTGTASENVPVMLTATAERVASTC